MIDNTVPRRASTLDTIAETTPRAALWGCPALSLELAIWLWNLLNHNYNLFVKHINQENLQQMVLEVAHLHFEEVGLLRFRQLLKGYLQRLQVVLQTFQKQR